MPAVLACGDEDEDEDIKVIICSVFPSPGVHIETLEVQGARAFRLRGGALPLHPRPLGMLVVVRQVMFGHFFFCTKAMNWESFPLMGTDPK